MQQVSRPSRSPRGPRAEPAGGGKPAGKDAPGAGPRKGGMFAELEEDEDNEGGTEADAAVADSAGEVLETAQLVGPDAVAGTAADPSQAQPAAQPAAKQTMAEKLRAMQIAEQEQEQQQANGQRA